MSGFVLLTDAGPSDVLSEMCGTLAHRGEEVTPVRAGSAGLAVLNRRGEGHFRAEVGRAGPFTAFVEGWVEDGDRSLARHGGASAADRLAGEFARHGTDSFATLRGALVAGVIDGESGHVSLFRGAQGQRPAYFWKGGGVFAAASEVKALLRHPRCPRRLDPRVLGHLLVTGVEPFDASLAASVDKVPPGYVVEYDPRGATTLRLVVPPAFPVRRFASEEEAADRLSELLGEGLRARLGEKGHAGLFLSGGIDSYLIGEQLSEGFRDRVVTGTGGVVGDPRDETAAAADRAARLGLPNVAVAWPEASNGTTLLDLLERTVETTEQPGRYENALLVTHLLDHWPERPGTLLSGDMADVLFGDAYYRALERAEMLQRWLPWWPRAGFAAALRGAPHRRARALAELLGTREHDFRLYFGGVFPHEGIERLLGFDPLVPIQNTFDRLVREADGLTTSQRYCYVHLRSSGQGSIDKLERLVSGVGGDLVHPFLTDEVYRLGFELPPDLKYGPARTKIVPRTLAARSLPAELAWGKRMGFSAPKDEWLQRDASLREGMEGLRRPDARVRAYVDAAELDRMVAGFGTPEGKQHAGNLWVLLSTELWCRRFGM